MNNLAHILFVSAALACTFSAVAISAALTCPPRGWDSYDSVPIWDGKTGILSEEQVMANAQFLSRFSAAGGAWKYIILDEGWADVRNEKPPNNFTWSFDGYGRIIPVVQQFPSSAGGLGLAPLVANLAKLNLELGIWHCKGIPQSIVDANLPIFGSANKSCTTGIITFKSNSSSSSTQRVCAWHKDMMDLDIDGPNGGCAQDYYNSVVDLWLSWGVTYMKIDCIFGTDLHESEIRAYSIAKRRAERKYNRKMLLSLSPGFLVTVPMIEKAQLLNLSVNMARVTNDLWDCFGPSLTPTAATCAISNVLATTVTLAYFAQNGLLAKRNAFGENFRPDPDMIAVSKIRLTSEPFLPHVARQSSFTGKQLNYIFGLWTVTLSPIVLGGSLRPADLENATHEQPQLRNLLTNPSLAEMHCRGINPVLLDWKPSSNILQNNTIGSSLWALGYDADNSGAPAWMTAFVAFFPFAV